MKTQKWIKLAFVALAAGVILQSCSKEEGLIPQDDLSVNPTFTVRPDFATLDTRPADVIAQFQVVETNPVKLDAAAKAGKYALVIGISDYAGTANDLQYCDDDAMDWKAELQSEGYSVTSLLDGNATKAAIESAINTLASQSIAGNEIAFIYSGHGSKGNIISADLYYISSSWFKTKFSAATSTKMMFSFDACQIGAMATDLKATGRVIAVASNKTVYSYDGDATMKNGVFTYYQMEGFSKQNYIYFEPDCDYAITNMLAWAKKNRVRVAPSYSDSYAGYFDL
ncbi:MAG: hypothetical protein A2W99_05065 [Bacteroidetes bacterium GWF2_33_16]|nr:MAG: hypothetical protein A2X00_17585 [Bacteroidetes bacterium GWE2_32_14]OFY06036.1 MAG: hypothetical protein A2W99_05065 [Bacteroidetes bacterium GWF2_33_16]